MRTSLVASVCVVALALQVSTTRASASGGRAPAGLQVPVARTAGGSATAVPIGDYECWGNGAARMLLNFTVTAPGRYKASDDSTGTFTFNASSQRIVFAGYLNDVMPDGFTSIYHEPKGIPTVSFRSGRGSEASFCELVRKR